MKSNLFSEVWQIAINWNELRVLSVHICTFPFASRQSPIFNEIGWHRAERTTLAHKWWRERERMVKCHMCLNSVRSLRLLISHCKCLVALLNINGIFICRNYFYSVELRNSLLPTPDGRETAARDTQSETDREMAEKK